MYMETKKQNKKNLKESKNRKADGFKNKRQITF